MYQIEIKIL